MISTIAFSTMIGMESASFRAMLDGCHQMDERFRDVQCERNLPVIMGLPSVLYENVFGAHQRAALRYGQYLRRFPTGLQQLRIERSGIEVILGGSCIGRHSSPIYFREWGINGQHSFNQRSHQGTRVLPCDFTASARPLNPLRRQDDTLVVDVVTRAEALAGGDLSRDIPANTLSRRDPKVKESA